MARPLTLALCLTAGCASASPEPSVASASAPASSPAPAAASSSAVPGSADAALDAFFDEVFERDVARSPELQTILGVRKDYGAWNDLSDARAREEHALDLQDLERLRGFDVAALSPAARVSYRVFEHLKTRDVEAFPWRFHSYPVNQMYGRHSGVVAFLINYHRVKSVADAEAYLSRLRGVPALFEQVEESLVAREKKGILPPKFVFPRVIGSCENLLSGRPFEPEAEKKNAVWADFEKKLDGLEELSVAERDRLMAEAKRVLVEAVGPAYRSLIALLKKQEAQATTDDGAWKLPNGDQFYAKALGWTTTTDMGPDEIHALGLSEVERIHGEMREIMAEVGFEGSLREFFAVMRTDPRFYYENDDAGRQAYLARAKSIIEDMRARLPEIFGTLPEADLVVKRVEPFREKAAGKAFYNRPALDGSTPGYYYANLYDMGDMPKYQMEALAYHEGIPGHHMQIALTQELEDLPKFRKFSSFTAYIEGWGLYSEYLPKELGFYEDPYSDFGRLAMELWRACRLVVDTGIHNEKWSREKAIAYLETNTPNPRGDVVKAIERYIVMPSQATAYKVGMNRILELRARAQAALGERFDLRAFHDTVLGNGPVPLSLLEELVDAWVAEASEA